MEDFLEMNIFFATTTAVVISVGVFGLVALFYVIRILRNVDHISRNVSLESDNIRGDISELRKKIRDEGMKMKHFVDLFANISARNAKKKKKVHHVGEV